MNYCVKCGQMYSGAPEHHPCAVKSATLTTSAPLPASTPVPGPHDHGWAIQRIAELEAELKAERDKLKYASDSIRSYAAIADIFDSNSIVCLEHMVESINNERVTSRELREVLAAEREAHARTKERIKHNACTDPCDTEEGPCACGAWHKLGEDTK